MVDQEGNLVGRRGDDSDERVVWGMVWCGTGARAEVGYLGMGGVVGGGVASLVVVA